MSIYEYDNYKEFVRDRIQAMPKRGRGEFGRIAQALKLHSTTVSQVFKGEKELTFEHAAKLCRYWGLTADESDYFLTMVEIRRAGAPELAQLLEQRMLQMRERAKLLQNRLPKDRVLSGEEQNRFYSHWYYSAVRLLCDLPDHRSVDRIAERLNLPRATVSEALQFLLACGMLVEREGVIQLGPKRTLIDGSSPLLSRHHINWRLQAIERMERTELQRDLTVTVPMTLSKADAQKIRKLAEEFVEEAFKLNASSPSEDLYFLNLDWLRL